MASWAGQLGLNSIRLCGPSEVCACSPGHARHSRVRPSETDSLTVTLLPPHPLLTGLRQQKAVETQDPHPAGLVSVLCLLPKAQGQSEAREATDYEIVLFSNTLQGPLS